MRKLFLRREDFELFHQDINPHDYEYYRSHSGAFKRMWQDQTRRFWQIFVSTFEYFIWNYGVMKDFPLKADEVRECVDEIIFYIRDQFVDGKAGTARALLMDCVIVTQNRHCLGLLDKASYASNPFYMRDTREIFRKLFGLPDSKRTYMKVLCGLPVYIKFAGAAVVMLRRWLEAEEVPSDDEVARDNFLESIHDEKVRTYDPTSEAKLHQALAVIQHERQQDKIVQSLAKYGGGKMGPFESPVPQPLNKATLELKAGRWKEKKSAARSKRAREKRAEEKQTEGSKKTPDEKLKDDKPTLDLKDSSEKKEVSATSHGDPSKSATPSLPDSTLQSGNKTEPGATKTEPGATKMEPGAENGTEAGTEVVKKKKRRRKKKRGALASSPLLEDGLGLDEDTLSPPLPEPIAEDKDKEEEEEKGKDEVAEMKEEQNRGKKMEEVKEEVMTEEKEKEEKEEEEKREMVEKEEEIKEEKREKAEEKKEEVEEGEKREIVEEEKKEEEKKEMVEEEEEEEKTMKTDTLSVKEEEEAEKKETATVSETEGSVLPAKGDTPACDKGENLQANDSGSSLIQAVMTTAGDTHVEEREEEKEGEEEKKEGEEEKKEEKQKEKEEKEEEKQKEKEEEEKEEDKEREEEEDEVSVMEGEEQSRSVAVAEGGSSKKRLHICGHCGCKETTAKSFKRCQKCRGKRDPKYYCSRDCQAKDWKKHKFVHKQD